MDEPDGTGRGHIEEGAEFGDGASRSEADAGGVEEGPDVERREFAASVVECHGWDIVQARVAPLRGSGDVWRVNAGLARG